LIEKLIAVFGGGDMADQLAICVVGCGRVSRSHLEGMREIPNEVKISAIVSSDPAKRESFSKEYLVPKSYAHLDDMLEDAEIEAVDLCLPNHVHKEATIKSVRAGKHVLVEKPMANTVKDCEEMIVAAEKAGVCLMVGQSRRFHDAVFKSKELLDQGKIGNLISITALLFAYLKNPPTRWWKSKKKTGGLMIPLWGNHIFDYVLWMFDEKPTHVFCEAYGNNPNWEGEDEVTVLIGFTRDRFATVKMSWNTKLMEVGEWDGKEKMLSSADIIYERYIQGTSGTMYLNDETMLKLNGNIVMQGPQKPSNFAVQIREFASAIRENREPLTSGKRVLDIIRIQEACLESARRHDVVRL
jgi:predicted dehydrogenase